MKSDNFHSCVSTNFRILRKNTAKQRRTKCYKLEARFSHEGRSWLRRHFYGSCVCCRESHAQWTRRSRSGCWWTWTWRCDPLPVPTRSTSMVHYSERWVLFLVCPVLLGPLPHLLRERMMLAGPSVDLNADWGDRDSGTKNERHASKLNFSCVVWRLWKVDKMKMVTQPPTSTSRATVRVCSWFMVAESCKTGFMSRMRFVCTRLQEPALIKRRGCNWRCSFWKQTRSFFSLFFFAKSGINRGCLVYLGPQTRDFCVSGRRVDLYGGDGLVTWQVLQTCLRQQQAHPRGGAGENRSRSAYFFGCVFFCCYCLRQNSQCRT